MKERSSAGVGRPRSGATAGSGSDADREVQAEDLRPVDVAVWRELREELDERQEARRRQLHFRRDPETYVRTLEERLLKLSLPAQFFLIAFETDWSQTRNTNRRSTT